MYVGDVLVVTSSKVTGEQSGTIKLMPGKHNFKIEYITGEERSHVLNVQMQSTTINKGIIETSLLSKYNVLPEITLSFISEQNYFSEIDEILRASGLDVDGSVVNIELFDNQKAILIGVPGAFTKVCSAKHLPGYVNNFEVAINKGITKIICISVNDPNVMKAWGENQNVGNKILMVSDPYCEFTKSIGTEIDRTEKGLGIRSARYTMLV